MASEIEECIRRRMPAEQTVVWHEEAVREKENALKRFGSMEMTLNDMKNDIKNIGENFNEWRAQNKIEHQQIMAAIKDVKDNTASKLTEKIVYGAVTIILAAVVTAIVYLVIKK